MYCFIKKITRNALQKAQGEGECPPPPTHTKKNLVRFNSVLLTSKLELLRIFTMKIFIANLSYCRGILAELNCVRNYPADLISLTDALN